MADTDNTSDALFTQMVAESGMPTTEAEMQKAWVQCNAEAGSPFSNSSAFSPFWRLITAIATKPCQWLLTLLVKHALPNVFLKYAAGSWLNVYAWGVNVTRKGAVSALGNLTFTRNPGTAGDVSIPVGTVVESPSINGTTYRVATLADAVIPDGHDSALVAVQAEATGAAYNLGPGYFSILPKPVPGVASVTNADDWLTTEGANEESDEALRLRCRNQFAAVGQYHHDAAYRAMIAEYASIRVDYIFFEKDAPRGPGTANAHIMTESGVPPQELVEAINSYIQTSGNHGHGDDLQCFAITTMPIVLQVRVYPPLGMDAKRAETLRLGVENRVRCAFRENSDFRVTRVLPLTRFSFSTLAQELHSQLPDLRSVEFTRPAPDGESEEGELVWEDIVPSRALPVLTSLEVVTEIGR